MMLKKYRPALAKIIPITLIIVIIISNRDTLRGVFIVPIAYLIFIFRLITGNIHQEVLWITFVCFSIIIALISLGMRWEPTLDEPPVETKYPTRLKSWLDTIQGNRRSEYFKWNLAQDLSNLFVEAIAYRRGISHTQVVQQLDAGNLDLPAEIIVYLQTAQKPFTQTRLSSHANDNWFTQIWETITRQPVPDGIRTKTALDIEPEKIIRCLEDYLELDPEIWVG